MTHRLLRPSLPWMILVSWLTGCTPEPWKSNLQPLDEANRARLVMASGSVPRINLSGGQTASLIMLAPGVGLTARHCLSDSFFQPTTVRGASGDIQVIEPAQLATAIHVKFLMHFDSGAVVEMPFFCWATVIDTSDHFERKRPEAMADQLVGRYQADDWAVLALAPVNTHALLAVGKHATRIDMETPLKPEDTFVAVGWKGGTNLQHVEARYEDVCWPADRKDADSADGVRSSEQPSVTPRSGAALFKTHEMGSMQGISGGPVLRLDAAADSEGGLPAPVVVGVNVYGSFWTPWALFMFEKPFWSQLTVSRPRLEPVEVYQASAREFAKKLSEIPRLNSSRVDAGTVCGLYDESGWLSDTEADTFTAAAVRILVDSNGDGHADLMTEQKQEPAKRSEEPLTEAP